MDKIRAIVYLFARRYLKTIASTICSSDIYNIRAIVIFCMTLFIKLVKVF